MTRFPLIEAGLCRCACEALVRAAGYPVPRKSACVFCPFATRGDFQRLAQVQPKLGTPAFAILLQTAISVVYIISFGFGGTNGSMLVGRL